MEAEKNMFNIAQDLQKNMGSLVAQLNGVLNNLPEDQRVKMQVHQAEINRVINLSKTGDVSGLVQIIENHANTNNVK